MKFLPMDDEIGTASAGRVRCGGILDTGTSGDHTHDVSNVSGPRQAACVLRSGHPGVGHSA